MLLDLNARMMARVINNANLIHEFVINLCSNSSPDKGFYFSDEYYQLLTQIKEFNYREIYKSPNFASFKKYVELIITTIYETLCAKYKDLNSAIPLCNVFTRSPLLNESLIHWLEKYSLQREKRYKNRIIFDITSPVEYKKSIIYFISGMTDQFAIRVFNELNEF